MKCEVLALQEVPPAEAEIIEPGGSASRFRSAGGFGADFTQNSLLAKYRPDLLHLPTTNGEHCTGDGIKMGEARPRVNCESRRSQGLVCSCSWRQERCQVGALALAGDRGEDHRPGVGAGPPDRPREAGRRGRQDQVPGRRGPAQRRAPAETRGPAPSPARARACLAPGLARRGRHHPERRGRALLQRAGPPRPHQVSSRPRCGPDSALALLCGGSGPGRDYVTGEMWKSKPPFRPPSARVFVPSEPPSAPCSCVQAVPQQGRLRRDHLALQA